MANCTFNDLCLCGNGEDEDDDDEGDEGDEEGEGEEGEEDITTCFINQLIIIDFYSFSFLHVILNRYS